MASQKSWSSLVAQMVKHLPTIQETQVQSLGLEDPLEKEMATRSSTLAWKIHGWRILVGPSSWGRKELDTTEQLPFRYSSVYLLNTYSQLSPFPIPFGNHESESVSHSVVSNSIQPH